MNMNKNTNTVDDSSYALEYFRAKALLSEKREIQTRLRVIDRELRHLQKSAEGEVNAAKSDMERE